MSFEELQSAIHQNAVEHGWWEGEREVPELLCLIHSEVSEALEGWRKGNMGNMAEELADVVIRVMDMAEYYEINLWQEIQTKHAVNIKRPYRHGGKKC